MIIYSYGTLAHRFTDGTSIALIIDFESVVETGGDCYARSKVGFRETLQCIDLHRQTMLKLPVGAIGRKVKGKPEGETVVRIEQPRGELLYYIKADGRKNWIGCGSAHLRLPTFRPWSPCCPVSICQTCR